MNSSTKIECYNCPFLCQKEVYLSEGEARLLNANKTEVIYNNNETLIKQGSFANDIFFVKDGIVKLFLENKNGKNIILQLVTSGSFIGFAAIKGEQLYNFSVAAVKQTVVCVIKNSVINEIVSKNHQFSNYLNDWLIKDHNMLYQKIRSVATKNMLGRIAEVLLYLDEECFKNEFIYEIMSKRDMSELAGVSLDSYTKTINEFIKEDLIVFDNDQKRYILKDAEKLKKISLYG